MCVAFLSKPITIGMFRRPLTHLTLQRQNRQHALLYSLVGAHYIGPVREVLRQVPGVRRQAIDLGTGTGKWYVYPSSVCHGAVNLTLLLG